MPSCQLGDELVVRLAGLEGQGHGTLIRKLLDTLEASPKDSGTEETLKRDGFWRTRQPLLREMQSRHLARRTEQQSVALPRLSKFKKELLWIGELDFLGETTLEGAESPGDLVYFPFVETHRPRFLKEFRS